MSGTLTGVGVGPGDPELMTIRAARCIADADCVAYIGADGRSSRARRIAELALRPGTPEIAIDMPMRADPAAGQAAYDRGAARIATELSAGRDVAFLCEGDPLLYGSFIYLLERLRPAHATAVIPGLPSFAACAAALQQPLVRRTDSFGLVPGTLGDAELLQRLSVLDAAAIMKVGRHRARVAAVLQQLGRLDDAVVVEEVSGLQQRIRPLAEVTDDLPYFATVILASRQGTADLSAGETGS